MANVKVYALGPDLQARGMANRVLDGVTVVDYAGFVDLVAEHSKGDRVCVSIKKKDGKLHLKVEENGQSFDLPRLFSETKGVGLTRMKQRAELSGGSLSIESGDASGMSLRASWPI